MLWLWWILLIVSFSALFFIFVQRLRATRRDLHFQENLAAELAEEAGEAAPEMDAGELGISEEVLNSHEQEKTMNAQDLRKLFMKADTHLSRREFEEAERLFLEILSEDESHLDANLKLGLMHMKLGDFPKAELYFSKLVNLKKDPIFFSNLGAALYQQARLIEAAEAYENAVALDDRRAERLQSLAQVYHKLGDHEKALHYFERAARRKPKDVELKWILLDYFERLERFVEAVELAKRILESDPYNKELKARLSAIEKRAQELGGEGGSPSEPS